MHAMLSGVVGMERDKDTENVLLCVEGRGTRKDGPGGGTGSGSPNATEMTVANNRQQR